MICHGCTEYKEVKYKYCKLWFMSVMSSDPQYIDTYARFTTAPFKPKSNQKCGR